MECCLPTTTHGEKDISSAVWIQLS